MKQRNYYVDFIRGIAIICIVLIHTAWHSGAKYTPEIVRNMTLLFESPMFFFIAGWTYSYSKSTKKYIKGLIKLQYRYMIYMTIVFIALLLLAPHTYKITNLVNWFFHNYTDTKPLQSVSYSLWFMRTYFVSSVLGVLVLNLLDENKSRYVCFILFLLILLQTFKLRIFSSIGIGLNVTLNFAVFYTFIFILGYLMRNVKINKIQFVLCILINIVILCVFKYVFNYDIFDIQKNKYSTNIVYLLWSMFGIYIVIFLKNYLLNMKENLICKLGKRTIYMYFAQGISSSILYYMVNLFNYKWYIKLPIMFIINLIMSIIIMMTIEITIESVIKLPLYIKRLKGIRNEKNI